MYIYVNKRVDLAPRGLALSIKKNFLLCLPLDHAIKRLTTSGLESTLRGLMVLDRRHVHDKRRKSKDLNNP